MIFFETCLEGKVAFLVVGKIGFLHKTICLTAHKVHIWIDNVFVEITLSPCIC